MADIIDPFKKEPKNADRKITPSDFNLDFWAPLYLDANENLFSPGFVQYTHKLNTWDIVQVNLQAVNNGKSTASAQWTQLPGICAVHFPRQKRKDSKKAVGSDSTTTTTYGIKAAEILIEMTIWTPQHWLALKKLLPLIFPKPRKDGGNTSSFQIKYPTLGLAGVNSVVFHSFEGPTNHSVSRAKHFKLHCTEWMPETKVKAGSTAPPPSLAKETSQAKVGLGTYPAPPGKTMSSQTEQNQSLPSDASFSQ